jgi:hypothetical protein
MDILTEAVQCGMPEKVRFQQTTFHLNCALDVITDLLSQSSFILAFNIADKINSHFGPSCTTLE